MNTHVASLCLCLAASGLPVAALGQNLLPNPGFEEGQDSLPGWALSGGLGRVAAAPAGAPQGRRWVGVEGNGADANAWHSAALPLRPGGLYGFEFTGRIEADGRDGTAVAGPSRVNRDFRLDDSWRPYSFVFSFPHDQRQDFARVGQWHVRGRLAFDDLALFPVWAAHTRLPSGGELGEGESIRNNVYRFAPDYAWRGANAHRPLVTNRAGFNSNRWLFQPQAEVVYRLGLPARPQRSASVRAAINYYDGGSLRIEASRDGTSWVPVAVLDGARRGGRADLPATLFPCDQLYVRLAQPDAGAGFQVDTFEYEASLQSPTEDAEGETVFLESRVLAPGWQVGIDRWERDAEGGGWRLQIAATNTTDRSITAMAGIATEGVAGQAPAAARPARATVRPGESTRFELAAPVAAAGEHRLRVDITEDSGQRLFAGSSMVRVGLLEDAGYGHGLGHVGGITAWWCEAGWKVGRNRPAPSPASGNSTQPVVLAAARNEYEAVQVVLRTTDAASLLEIPAVALTDPRGRPSPIGIRWDEVAYVHVTQPTDSSCVRGWYPDPLPPLRTPLALGAQQNQPLWLTVRVPAEADAGRHRGTIRLTTSGGTLQVPLDITVYDFALPAESHLRSALGLGTGEINRYHRLRSQEDKVAVFEKYLKNFAEHRISPYSFYDYAPMQVRFEGEGSHKQARLDWAAFDRAGARWLDEHHFNTFQLPLRGMGGGTFHSRHLGELEGFQEGTPEHAALFRDYLGQVERHLRDKGWLGKAFTYWFDEPDPKDYAFVVAGQQRIKQAAPGIKRMLTEQPEPELAGHVDIWCGLTPEWTPEQVQARRAAGEEVWWYICTGPKAPYVTEFIDHPGTELRLWPWQSWQYGVSGILVWATVYWSSPLAYPEPHVQDPWTDPMSWVSGYGNPVGHRSPWGNGDGRFLYPPRRDPNASTAPVLDEPINSLRWDSLRDGMEDYEYLWLLDQELKRAAARARPDRLEQEARALLTVPPAVSKDLTHFTTDPRTILEHRERIARMIERLRKAND